MSRLFTTGFEMGVGPAAATALNGEDSTFVYDQSAGSTVTRETATVRSGASALRVATTTANSYEVHVPITVVVTRAYFIRIAINVTTFPASGVCYPVSFHDGTHGIEIMLSSTGVLTLANGSNDVAVTGVTTFTASTGTWYVLEVSYTPNTGACEMKIDGTSHGTGTAETSALTAFRLTVNTQGSTGACNVVYDDWALNDDQGASQNSWCGNTAKVVLLKPVSDSSTTGFTAGAGGATSLFAGVDNTPPTGKVLASATNTTQIKDATSNTTDNYQANLGAYTTAIASGGGGMGSTDTVQLVQGICNHANSTVTSRTNGLQVVSNPAVAEATGATGAVAAATFPTGWTTLKTAVSAAPSVTLGTSPVVEFRKATASTDSSMADFMGLYVEYTPGAPAAATPSALVVPSTAVMVPSGW